MLVRLGYVAMTMNLKDCSPSGTVTLKTLTSMTNDEARLYKLRKVTGTNLQNTLRILRYNKAYNIKVYRFTSKLVPLATHPIVSHWDYIQEFRNEFRELGDFVKQNDFRVSAHPDHYTLLNSPSKKVLEASLRDLDYHVKLFEAMGLDDSRYKLVMHIGGFYRDKLTSIERFKENYRSLPDRIRKRLIFENDDKVYTAREVLDICREIGAPMVLDVHHHNCVNNGEMLENILREVFETWKDDYYPPKIHFSTPKSCDSFRSHADDIDTNEFHQFLGIANKIQKDFDVMIEAKNKDTALLGLSKELEQYGDIIYINEGHFRVDKDFLEV